MRSLLFPIFLCLSCFALAAPGVRISPAPAWLYKSSLRPIKTPALGSVTSGYYLELADQQVNLAAQTAYTHFIRHIINPSGVQNASEVSVTFSPAFQQVVFHRLVIIRDGVEINQLKENAIKVVQEETDASDFQYNGLKRAFVTLKDVQNGDRIDMAWSIVGENPVFAGRYSDDFNFYNEDPVDNFFITVIAPASRKLQLKAFNNAPAPQEQVLNGNRVYHWDNPPIQITGTQSNAPSWFNPYPYTSMTEFGNWEDVVQWALTLFNNYRYPLPAGLRDRMTAWRKVANGNKDVFANLATRFVQDEVRYLGLEIGAHTHLPHTPADVYQHRFGDCKDKALLLATILQQEKIPAYVAMVNTSLRRALADAAPSSGDFDHAIVAVERPAGYLYIDPTVSLQGGNLTGRYIPAYGYALLVRGGEKSLQPILPNVPYATNVVESMEVSYDDSSSLTVDTYFSGGAADNIRSTISNSSRRDIEEDYRQFYAKTYEGIQLNAPLQMTDDTAANEYHIKENYSIPDVWRTGEKGKKTFEPFAKMVFDYLPDPSAVPARTPLALAYPRKLSYTMELNMPDDWTLGFSEWHTKNDYYEFSYTPEVGGRHITLHFTWETFSDHIPPEAVAQYRDDYKKILDEADFTLSITAPSTATSDNSTSPATTSPVVTTAPAAADTSHDKANWEAIWLVFGLGVVFTALFKWLNGMAVPVRYNAGSGEPVRGWVVVLAISLGLTAGLQIYSLVSSNYFDPKVYAQLGETGGRKLQYLSLTEVGVYVWGIAATLAALYWLLARRDIFPRMFTWMVVSYLASEVLLMILYHAILSGKSDRLQSDMLLQVFHTMVYGAIWISYLSRSERVKNTFVVPFDKRKDGNM